MEATSEPGAIDSALRPARKPRVGLSGKLLLLTVLFVMVAEILIYVPSVANFRLNWLSDRLAAAHKFLPVPKQAGRLIGIKKK